MTAEEIYDLISMADRQDNLIAKSPKSELTTEAKRICAKQIAKKPNYEGDGYYNGELVYDTWICPCCEKRYEVDYDEYDYCPNCGQKLDWSDKNA